MAWLPYITDKKLTIAVKHLLDKADSIVSENHRKFQKNIIDPFSIIFETAGFHIPGGIAAWEELEMTRQTQKSLSNEYGLFHQRILGSIRNWSDLNTGNVVDLENNHRKIIAEIKNKYNTTKGAEKVNIYNDLESLVMPKGHKYHGYTAYYVEIIPKYTKAHHTRFNLAFTPSDRKTGTNCQPNQLIRRIDGSSFYELVTDTPQALERLFNALPEVVKKINNYKYSKADLAKLDYYSTMAI